MKSSGLGVKSSGLGVKSSGLGVKSSGLGVKSSGLGVKSSGLGVRLQQMGDETGLLFILPPTQDGTDPDQLPSSSIQWMDGFPESVCPFLQKKCTVSPG